MAIDFPSSPSVGQIYESGSIAWVWTGTTWDIASNGPVVYKHAINHAVGGIDAVTVAQSQVTNLVSDLAAKAPLASPTFTGNVGIGTSSPGYKLDVNGSLNATSFYLNGTSFRGGATGGGTDDVFYENGQTVNTSYTITTNKNAMTAGPVTIANGVTVTVPSGSVWVVV